MLKNKISWSIGALLFVLIAVFFSYHVYKVNLAHTTFEHYYAFRGCVELVDKTETYGHCKLANGQIIKMVLYENAWYLDGDLPSRWGNFTF